MPTYVYKFVDTGETIEVQQAFTDDTLTEYVHPESGDVLPVKKVFQPVGVTFKGSGFFKTDNRGVEGDHPTGHDIRVVEWRIVRVRHVEQHDLDIVRHLVGSEYPVAQGAVTEEVVHLDRLLGLNPVDVPLDPRAADIGAEVGVFGGSGFYEFVSDADDVEIDTPFGPPAAPIRVGTLAGRRVAFLARHGRSHEFAAHRIPYRANVWALASLGVRSIVAPCSVGSLQPHLSVGDFVVLDQLVDRTHGRAGTFHDVGAGDGLPGSDGSVHHQPFADPYDAGLREALVTAGRELDGPAVHDGGTMVVINGPRFSTRAESQWHAAMGWDVVNMTGAPEAVLAAEAGVPYASVALVTDRDAGDPHAPDAVAAVTMDDVMVTVRQNVAHVRGLIELALPDLP